MKAVGSGPVIFSNDGLRPAGSDEIGVEEAEVGAADRDPVGASSRRSASLSASTPALAEAYGPIIGACVTAASEAMFSR